MAGTGRSVVVIDGVNYRISAFFVPDTDEIVFQVAPPAKLETSGMLSSWALPQLTVKRDILSGPLPLTEGSGRWDNGGDRSMTLRVLEGAPEKWIRSR